MPQTAPAKPVPPLPLQEGAMATMDAPRLMALLASGTEFQKAKACVRLGELGATEAVPALAGLLADEHLGVYARNGLEPMASPAVDDALRASLPKLKGVALIGVVNSLGKRRDAKAVPALAKMLHGPNVELARAAAAALGHIGAAAELQAALPKVKGPLLLAVADACLVCAEHLLAEGQREAAFAIYNALSAPGMPKPMRLAAMGAIIREETAPGRPR